MDTTSFQQIDVNPIEGTVYKNVIKFCEYNDIKLTEGYGHSEEKTKKIIDIQSFLMIKGVLHGSDIDDDNTGIAFYIFIFGQKSTTTNKTAFGNKADDIANVMGMIKETRAAIMFVSENSFKTNVVKAIANQSMKKQAKFQIRSVIHDIFKLDRIADAIDNNKAVHTILTPDESTLIKAQYEKNLTTMPYIPIMDPIVIWLMGNVKQIVKITHPSILGCHTVYYRVIR
jgi:DNA-directed RNA polymerase subunit H (RpoH/RPB5)